MEPRDQHKYGDEICYASYYLAHGSLAAGLDDAASLRMSKPVRLGRGAMLLAWQVSINLCDYG